MVITFELLKNDAFIINWLIKPEQENAIEIKLTQNYTIQVSPAVSNN